MFTIGTAAYKIYSASSQVGSTLSTLSSYHKYVTEAIFNSPSEVENLHPLVKQNLDRLARRIQVLSSPLNYCLLWSQHRGSAVAETIHQSKEVLKQTYHWLHQCNKDKTKLSDKEYMLKKLDEHIREIDFCLQALNLALSIIQTTDSNHSHSHSASSTISPSSLLTASNRIHAMHNSGGDVAVCFGQLFKKCVTKNNLGWLRIYRRSALKIYRNGIRRSYELRIECNEYGCDSDDDFGMDLMNESYPLTLKFDLTSALCFTTLSSLIIDLPIQINRNISFTKSNINLNNLNKNDLIEDAFGWVKMIANQVQEQYIFVLKSGLDDWDKPLSSQDDMNHVNIKSQQSTPVKKSPIIHKISPTKSPIKKTSLIFLKDDDKNETEEHMSISDTDTPLYIHNNNNNNNNNKESSEYNVTSSIASLDTAVIQTKRRTHLGSLLAPGGDYDQTHITPQLMAYITRLSIYENDYNKPQTIHHTNSTFKKYNSNNEKMNDLTMNDSDNNSVLITSHTLNKQISNSNSNEESYSEDKNDQSRNDLSQEEYNIKQQQKIPAHLHASDEELYLFLRNPPTPPVPFYPKNVKFTNDKIQGHNTYYNKRFKTRKHAYKQKNKSPNKSKSKNTYFAAPNNNNNNNDDEVTVTFMDKKYKNTNQQSYQLCDDTIINENLELSISDENHMKYIKKQDNNNNNNNSNNITPKTMMAKTKKSMNAIKDATQSSLLENVDLTASQELSNVNSPRNENNNDTILTGNFANLSIDNDD